MSAFFPGQISIGTDGQYSIGADNPYGSPVAVTAQPKIKTTCPPLGKVLNVNPVLKNKGTSNAGQLAPPLVLQLSVVQLRPAEGASRTTVPLAFAGPRLATVMV